MSSPVRRILILNTDLEIGGTPTVVREIATRLNRAGGAVVEVACLSKWGPVADQIRDAGVPVHAFDARGMKDFPGTVRKLVRIVREQKFDTVFSFLMHANVVAAAASTVLQDVRFIQAIQTTQPTPRWHWWLQSIAQQAAECVVVPSPSVAKVARDWARVPVDKIVIIPNAIDAESFDLPVSPLAKGPFRIGFLGRLDPIKRVPLLVAAMKQLDERFSLDIYGDGPDRSNIERAIASHNVTDRVHLRGRTSTPRDTLREMNVLALPSLAEGFPLVLIEAMAAGVSIVAADSPGITDVITDGATGLLADPTDAARFARRLVDAFDTGRESRIAAAYNEVRTKYVWHVVLPQYLRLLKLA